MNRTSNRPPNPATKRVRNVAAAAALLVAIAIAASAAPARADQWSKTYQVNGRADLHVTDWRWRRHRHRHGPAPD